MDLENIRIQLSEIENDVGYLKGATPDLASGILQPLSISSHEHFNHVHAELDNLEWNEENLTVLHNKYKPRTDEIHKIYAQLDYSYSALHKAMTRLEANFQLFIALPEYHSILKQHLEPRAFALYHDYQRWWDKKNDQKSPRRHLLPWQKDKEIPNPVENYHHYLQDIKQQVDVLKLMMFIYAYDTNGLAISMCATAVKETALLFPLDGLYNWPIVSKAIRSLKQSKMILEGQTCGLSGNEIFLLTEKLRIVEIKVFNSEESRKGNFANYGEPPIWPLPLVRDPPLEVEFLTREQYFGNIFRDLARLYFRMITIEGDGNCFFRAVIKYLMPDIPRDAEDALSLILRQTVNQRGRYNNLNEFVVPNVNDSVVMSQAGVWADHLQIQKVADALKRSIWILRLDDVEITMDTQHIVPSMQYRVQPANEVPNNQIHVYYSPNPGHYEVLLPQRLYAVRYEWDRAVYRFEHNELPKEPTNATIPEPFFLCNIFFIISHKITRFTAAVNSASSTYSRDEVKSRARDLASLVFHLRITLESLGKNYLSQLKDNPAFFLIEPILAPLIDDPLTILPGEVLSQGKGPLSELCRTLRPLVDRHPKQDDDFSCLLPITNVKS